MLAKIVPRFVISGVIQNSYYANYMAVDLSKQIIGDNANAYDYDNPKKYFECNFYGYLSTLPKPQEFTNQFEVQKYDQACERFRVYNEVKQIYNQLNEFTLEVKELFRVVESNNTSSNFLTRGDATDTTWQQDLNDCLNRYTVFLKQLEGYPQWQQKVIGDVGKWFLMINNNLAEGDTKHNIFVKLNRQEYFV